LTWTIPEANEPGEWAEVVTDFPYVATQTQKALIKEHFTGGAQAHYCALLDKAQAFRDALVQLPHVNEDGERVVNGANRWMTALGEPYYDAAMALRQYVDRDWVSLETEKRGFRSSGFYARPYLGEVSYVHKRAFLPGEAPERPR
jgi:hypothetical protein